MTADSYKSSTSDTKAEDLGFQTILGLDAIKNLHQNKDDNDKGSHGGPDLYHISGDLTDYLSGNLWEMINLYRVI